MSSLAFGLSEPASNIRAFGMRVLTGLMYYKGKSILQITAKKYVEVVQAVFENWTLFSILFNFASKDYKFGF